MVELPIESEKSPNSQEIERLRKRIAELESEIRANETSQTSEQAQHNIVAGPNSPRTLAALRRRARPAIINHAATMPPPPRTLQTGLISDALSGPADAKQSITADERRARIRSNLIECVAPYTRVSQDAWDIVQKYGDEEIWEKCRDPSILQELRPQPTFESHLFKQGVVRPSEYEGLPFSCRLCSRKHPTDICGKLYQVCSLVYNRDPGWYKEEKLINLDHDRWPCITCSHEGNTHVAELHYSMQHNQSTFYEHTHNPSLIEMLEEAESPEEILLIVPMVYHWPSRLQRKEPLPLYCFYPHRFDRPSALPVVWRPLTYGLRDADGDIAVAIQTQMNRESRERAARKQTSSQKRISLPASGSEQSLDDLSAC